jgi:glutamate/tyrosine decarboxylase-like PLP-dependent enzyme
VGSPATVASAGPRYFGFVVGGTLPAALGASWLVSAWDQNAALPVMSPVAARAEEVALRWVVELLGLPAGTAGVCTTGTTMANAAALAAARDHVLAGVGWDAPEQGLFGAPPVTVVVGDEVHASVRKALSMVGLGRERVVAVSTDAQGRMRADALPSLEPPAIVCAQAGNVNSGGFDPFVPIAELAREVGAWVHVDGAFGLWAAASPRHARLAEGVALADSWATDAHKWLNTGYDCGLVLVRDQRDLARTLATSAAYLDVGVAGGMHLSPESSRRARGVELWAALLSLGRSGVADLVDRCCALARRLADGLAASGITVLNEVVLNQVVVTFGDAARTAQVVDAVQTDGTCWCGPTEWRGRPAMRISVSSWATTDADVDRSVDAIRRAAA